MRIAKVKKLPSPNIRNCIVIGKEHVKFKTSGNVCGRAHAQTKNSLIFAFTNLI